MDAVLLAGATALLGMLGLGAAQAYEHSARAKTWQTVRLHFGRDVTPEAVILVVDRLAESSESLDGTERSPVAEPEEPHAVEEDEE